MKKTIITVLLVLLVAAVAVGFYRGWFAFSSRGPDAESNKANLKLTVDPDKMKEDAKAVQGKTAELTGSPATGTGELKRDDQEKSEGP